MIASRRIDPTILAKLGLSPTGSTPMVTPLTGAGSHMADQYDASVAIYATATQAPLLIAASPVIACDFSAQGIDALIGRDILGNCVLVYNGGEQTFTLAY